MIAGWHCLTGKASERVNAAAPLAEKTQNNGKSGKEACLDMNDTVHWVQYYKFYYF